MVIITEVKSCLDLVLKASEFANQLQDGWYKGSAEVESFKAQVSILRQKHDQWSAQLRRHGVSEDERLLRAVQAAVQVLDKQEQYVSRLQKNNLLRLRRKAFPGQLTYVLKNVSDIVDAGPQLLAARVDTFDVLERIVALTPAPLPFIPDPNYVPISESVLEIRKALEDKEGPRVVTVFGGPGLGKSSVVKYLALQYEEERKQGLKQPPSNPLSFPYGVYYLFCGKDAQESVKQLELELVECLGFGPGSSSAPLNDQTGNGMQEGGYLQLPLHRMKLRSRLAEQTLLIVLDDVWERQVLQQLLQLVPAKGVRFLVTSQMKEIWDSAAKVQMRYPNLAEATQIMSNYTNGLTMKGKFPDNIQSVIHTIISKVGYLPLSLAHVGISVNSSRATDASHWEAINDNLHQVLLQEDDFQVSPGMYEKYYDRTVAASMLLMVESLTPRPDARRLLFLIALLRGDHLPETLVRYFYKWIQPAQSTAFHRLNYENQEKYLADRSLIDLHMQGNESTWESMPYMRGQRTLAGHCLRMRFIRERKSLEVRSIAAHILESSNQGGTELIEKGDAEATLVTVLSAIYFQEPFTDVLVNTLEKHRQTIYDGTIPRSLSTDIDPHDLVKMTTLKTRYGFKDLVWLINVDRGDPAWKQQAHGYAKKIIIKLAYQGKLDDNSMASLLQLPQTTSVACAVVEGYARSWGDFDVMPPFSSAHGKTMNALLALLRDDGASTTRRVPVIGALGAVLDYESKDTILSVAAKYMELLAMDFSDSTLQTAVADSLSSYLPSRAAIVIIGEFTGILDLLVALLVSVKDYEVRLSAGRSLWRLCHWKCIALKVAAIPDAVEKLFNLFLTTVTPSQVASTELERLLLRDWAGYILRDLASVEENRIKFRAIQSGSLRGLGNILARLKETWQGTQSEKHRTELTERASIAARILDELARDKELRHSIASLPELEEGLLFLQLIDIDRSKDSYLWPFDSTLALTKLCYASTNPRLRDVPTLKQLQAVSSSPAMGARECFGIYWSRLQVHCDVGAYEEALENLELAQLHFDQLPTPDGIGLVGMEIMELRFVYRPWSVCYTAEMLRWDRIFLEAMLGDYTSALLGADGEVERTQQSNLPIYLSRRAKFCGQQSNLCLYLTWRGIVRRLCRDLSGALDDLDAAYQLRHDLGQENYFDFTILQHRGYIKYLMKDEVGARADAEAAQQLQRKTTRYVIGIESVTDDKYFGEPSHLWVASTELERLLLRKLAGYILRDLASVEENRIKFRTIQSGSLRGLGNILARLKETWQGTQSEKHRTELTDRASRAAGILDQLARDKELRHSIASLPGLEEGLLFLQLIEINTSNDYPWVWPFNSTMALTRLCYASTNPRLRDVPTLKQLQAVSSSPAMGACECFGIYWTRFEVHFHMGAYEEALENLELALLHFDQIPTPDRVVLVGMNLVVMTFSYYSLYADYAAEMLRWAWIFLEAMLGDYTNALLGADGEVEITRTQQSNLPIYLRRRAEMCGQQSNLCLYLTWRGIVRRLCRDLSGALDDLDAAYQLRQDLGQENKLDFTILQHRGYIKYLMKDEVGARADVEAAQQLQRKTTRCVIGIESIADEIFLGGPWHLPLNYLGYFSSSKSSLF